MDSAAFPFLHTAMLQVMLSGLESVGLTSTLLIVRSGRSHHDVLKVSSSVL